MRFRRFITHFLRICFQASMPDDELVLLDSKDFVSFKLNKEAFGETKLEDIFPSVTQNMMSTLNAWYSAKLIADEIIGKDNYGVGHKMYS